MPASRELMSCATLPRSRPLTFCRYLNETLLILTVDLDRRICFFNLGDIPQ